MIEQLASDVRNQHVGIMAFDTIWGFCGLFNLSVIERIATLKERSLEKQFIILISNLDMLAEFVDLEHYHAIFDQYWPGPNTLILSVKPGTWYPYETIAVRFSDYGLLNQFITAVNYPIISTSVNKSAQPALNDYDEIVRHWDDDVDFIATTFEPQYQQASSIYDCTKQHVIKIR